ncbi:MAG: exodeoxyribonuclease VII large subunit [Anaerolineales bacterium]|nr:exodeoxyribonuclease VII large subunit [Anaerolineales bacterium]
MQQLSLFRSDCLTVTQINRLARSTLEREPLLQDVWVGGEVSGVSRPASGHLYFTLKDSAASLRCVMWRDAAARIPPPREGEAVEAHGRISLYEAGGQYQLYVDTLRLAGQGELFAEFLRLKAKLESEGLFDPQRKRPIPRWPARIAVVTSPIGAAWRDVQTVLARRFPLAEVLFAPAVVQGEEAPPRLCSALRAADRAKADVVLLVRGGGSIEDLWAFNDEELVRTVAAMQTPVVTGVGHETDFTLADFAADLRAPTPSAAAELVSPDRADLVQEIRRSRRRLALAVESALRAKCELLYSTEIRMRGASPVHRLQNIRQQIDELTRRAEASIRNRVSLRRTALQGLARVLEGMGPAGVLDRGYALVRRADDGRLVRSVVHAPAGTMLRVQVKDGDFRARSEGAENSAAAR